MGRKRLLGLALASVALALVAWGLLSAVRVDFPPAEAASPPATARR